MSASRPHLIMISKLISGFHDRKWCCARKRAWRVDCWAWAQLAHPCGGRPVLELLDLASVKINKPNRGG